jgi:polyferredoxin
VEHACFLASGLLFWWPLVQPYPSRARWPQAALIPYLFLAAMQSTALCALLAFADRVIYPHYAAAPRVWGLSAIEDQELAGAMMWVVGMLTFLPPLATIGYRLLYDTAAPRARLQYAGAPAGFDFRSDDDPATASNLLRDAAVSRHTRGAPSSGLVILDQAEAQPGFDLLRTPVLGRMLRSAVARRVAQTALLAVAAVIIVDGLFGPQISPLNLAGVLPWIHWRGLVVLVLLVAGNFFCMACPFMLPRAIARRVLAPTRDWPAWLRSKWLAVGLLAAFFWAYEALDLWASPWWTAWIAVAYLLLALAVDLFFRGAAFCKYVCPVGQFQFVQSLVSPLEVRVRDPAVCATCRTHDCLRGGPQGRGCETDLFAPRKRGNFDCTFCLDCARACPTANIGLLVTSPLLALTEENAAAKASRLLVRPDGAALLFLLVFAAFANAAGMVAPVARVQDQLVAALHWPLVVVESFYLAIALLAGPIALVTLVGFASRRFSGEVEGVSQVIARFARALVPIGAAMWLAHYGFHLATGPLAFAPPAERFLAEWGGPSLGAAKIAHCCCAADVSPWLLRAEIMALDFGMLASLYVGYRIAAARFKELGRAAGAFLPWGALVLLLFAIGVWIVFQPMEMRGMMAAGGSG